MPARLLKIAAIIYAVYLGVAFLVLMPALNIAAPKLAREYLNREWRSELILFNPFTLAAEVRGAHLADPDGSTFVAFDRLEANLSLAGLWQEGWVLDAARLNGLEVNVTRETETGFNFSDLIPPPDPDPQPSGPIPGVTVTAVDFSARRLAFRDQTKTPVYGTAIENLDLDVSNLSTVITDDAPYTLKLRSEGGGAFAWEGEVSLPEGSSEGLVVLEGLDLEPAYRYLQDELGFVVTDGRLGFRTHYAVNWKDSFAAQLSDGDFHVEQLGLVPHNAEDRERTHLRVGRLSLHQIALDTAAQTVSIGDIELLGSSAGTAIDEQGASLARLLTPPASGAGDEPEEATPPADPAQKPWQIAIGDVRTDDLGLRLESQLTRPEVLAISPVKLQVSDITWPSRGPSALEVAATINDEARLGTTGSLDLGTGSGALQASVAALPVAWFVPHWENIIRWNVKSGTIEAGAELALAEFQPTTISAEVSLPGFNVVTQGTEATTTKWQTLDITGIEVNLPGQDVQVGEVILDGLSASIWIDEEGKINAQRALVVQEGEEIEDAEQVLQDAAQETSATWHFGLDRLTLQSGTIDFRDRSLPLPFAAVVENLHGDIENVDTRGAGEISVVLDGDVDGYAPVAVRSNSSPFGDPAKFAVDVRFTGMDISSMTPYSGTYAGYAIDQGTLSLNLIYTLDGTQLKGANDIVIKQMKLGDRIESDRAVDLPLELALALLTDSNGVIDLDVPVSGSVDSPEFSVGALIGKAIANIIVKAATAPFRLLAGLVGSEQDLQTIEFDPASAELNATGQEALMTLAEALTQRPQLNLLVAGSVVPDRDLPPLQMAKLEQALLSEGLSEEVIAARGEEWGEAIQARYAQQFPTAAMDQEGDPAAAPAMPPLEAQVEALANTFTIETAVLAELARARAAAVKTLLVNDGGIDASRIALKRVPETVPEGAAGVELDVDV